jgi:hypothetical protein
MASHAPKGYLATDEQVASLAKDYVKNAEGAENARGTYLRILVAHSLRELHKSSHKRYSTAEALGAVEAAHTHLYAIVVEATLTPDVMPEPGASDEERRRRTTERNRRTTFARSSKSALVGFIKAGGRLATLTPAEVNRDALTRFARAAREGPKTLQERFEGLAERLAEKDPTLARGVVGELHVNLLKQLMKEDPEAGREAVEGLQVELEAILTPPRRMTGKRKVGSLTLHAE